MGFRSAVMFHLRHVDPVIRPVRADPFDPDDAFLEIDRHDQAIGITLDIEDDPLGTEVVPIFRTKR
ncbi:hypothetical protein EMQ_2721 [Acetobacter aceti NBRC 14818]|uniref:Uncharacterized protein n=1 Tax=Acetobacter aceti NBRC 14818 TaxID=887700 RepID=A0AB33IG39_ACEAC|nr:hypothetical protein EMQ_2721 [Acetobacter aceti NBRC 14818]